MRPPAVLEFMPSKDMPIRTLPTSGGACAPEWQRSVLAALDGIPLNQASLYEMASAGQGSPKGPHRRKILVDTQCSSEFSDALALLQVGGPISLMAHPSHEHRLYYLTERGKQLITQGFGKLSVKR